MRFRCYIFSRFLSSEGHNFQNSNAFSWPMMWNRSILAALDINHSSTKEFATRKDGQQQFKTQVCNGFEPSNIYEIRFAWKHYYQSMCRLAGAESTGWREQQKTASRSLISKERMMFTFIPGPGQLGFYFNCLCLLRCGHCTRCWATKHQGTRIRFAANVRSIEGEPAIFVPEPVLIMYAYKQT